MMKMRVRVKRRLKKAASRVRATSAHRSRKTASHFSALRSCSGSAAIEFAFVAPIFFLFLMATMETGLIYLGNFVLQNATNDAARQIRTGQVAASGMTQVQFRTLICNGIKMLLVCDPNSQNDNLQIDVEAFPNFAAANINNPILAGGGLDPALKNWSPGEACGIVLVRAFYSWNVVTPLLTPFLVNMSGSNHLLSAAAAFRNEPFNNAVAGC
jgi:Flp pilus assembly protein TadG